MSGALWTPSTEGVARAALTRFIADVGARASATVHDYQSLYAWSIDRPHEFWSAVWEFTGIVADRDANGKSWRTVLAGGDRMAPPDHELGPRWFDGARLNFAENLLRFHDERLAIIAWNELGAQRRITYRELHAEVARLSSALRGCGVGIGDRVVGFMPNIPEAVIAMLATASL
ncbi:MAG TPA: AMP-binding protein, partial [Gemmatimonadaceae bacterium]|nr:AMP-binding protein [Gemmatimonadaceae bacterium]